MDKTKTAICLAAGLLLLAPASGQTVAPTKKPGRTPELSAQAFVKRFCAAVDAGDFGGNPGQSNSRIYEMYCGEEVIRAVRYGAKCQAKWIREVPRLRDKIYPDQVGQPMQIPHINGGAATLFEGWSEGPTTYRVGRVRVHHGRVKVEVHRDWHDRRDQAHWTDLVCLERTSDGWVVRDIEYGNDGTLLDTLEGFSSSINEEVRAFRDHANRLPKKGASQ